MQRWIKMMAATPTKMKKREITKAMIRAWRRRERNLGLGFAAGCKVVSGKDSSEGCG